MTDVESTLPIPSDAELDSAGGDHFAIKDARRNARTLAAAKSPLPPSSPMLALAHDLAAALDAGDATRAFESAAALSDSVGVIFDVLDDGATDYAAARERAFARVRAR